MFEIYLLHALQILMIILESILEINFKNVKNVLNTSPQAVNLEHIKFKHETSDTLFTQGKKMFFKI